MIETDQTQIYIQPRELLEVTVSERFGRRREIAATLCRYMVVTDRDGQRKVAIEIVYDAESLWPRKAYYCPAARLVREVLDVKHVVSVEPYTA